MIVRICTEDTGNVEAIQELVGMSFDAYTIYQGSGVWKGCKEPSLTIDIAVLASDRYVEECASAVIKAYSIARAIKVLNRQEAVLVEIIQSTNQLV